MAINQNQQENRKKLGIKYPLLISLSVLFSIVTVIGIFHYWDEIQNAQGYGYLTNFFMSIIGGTLIIPISNLPVVFTLGNRLNPVYVGLVAGFGEAIGGITVYLTGAGGKVLWSKFLSGRQALYKKPDLKLHKSAQAKPHRRPRWQILAERLAGWLGRLGGSWSIFITAALVWWLSYPAALAAGASKTSLRRFFLLSWAGKTIRGLIIAFAGYWGLNLLSKIPFLSQWLGG